MIAPELEQLVFHGLACWPVRGPENLFDPAYVGHVHASAPLAIQHLAADAPLAARLWSTEHRVLQLLFLLHEDVESFLRQAATPLERLEDVCAPRLLERIRALDPTLVEVLRADLALDCSAWRDWYAVGEPAREVAWATLEPWLERIRARVPSLGHVEGVLSLGRRGRVLGDRILVGLPVPWMEIEPGFPAITAGHEACVRAAQGDYVTGELSALVDLALRLDGEPELAPLHGEWLEGLALGELAQEAVRRGLILPADAAALADQPRDALLGLGRRQALGPRAGT